MVFKLENGLHASMEQPACVVTSETFPISEFRRKLLNLYVCPSTMLSAKVPHSRSSLINCACSELSSKLEK